ncbi:MAG: redoxin domain-containing protein [Chloroflexi bacterium]|nr:redoxin domain-containing protein [Chloroflexota bacterium]
MGLVPILTGIVNRRRVFAALGAVMLVAMACGSSSGDSASADPASGATGSGTAAVAEDAVPERSVLKPEITGISNWINSEPTTVEAEIALGNVVLIDFWTYTCVNCIRTLPHLRAWEEKYGDRGLTIIGVHSPEFDFEKLTENVEDAVVRLDVTWRVAQDNDMETWRRFGNRFWPAKYLFSTEGSAGWDIFYLRVFNGNLECVVGDGTRGNIISIPASAITTGVWHHIACERDASNWSLWLDGVRVASAASSSYLPPVGARPLGLGGDYRSPPEAFSFRGLIDEVRISSVVRYTAAFTPAYRFAVDAATVALWHFDEGVGIPSPTLPSLQLK